MDNGYFSTENIMAGIGAMVAGLVFWGALEATCALTVVVENMSNPAPTATVVKLAKS